MFKKTLSSILSSFQKTHDELEEWEELSKAEQEKHEQRLNAIKTERERAAKVREQLKTILGL